MVPIGSAWRNEHRVHGLEIELRRQIHHGEILVVEIAMLGLAVAVSGDEMAEEFLVRREVAVEIHRHEAGELQEAR